MKFPKRDHWSGQSHWIIFWQEALPHLESQPLLQRLKEPPQNEHIQNTRIKYLLIKVWVLVCFGFYFFFFLSPFWLFGQKPHSKSNAFCNSSPIMSLKIFILEKESIRLFTLTFVVSEITDIRKNIFTWSSQNDNWLFTYADQMYYVPLNHWYLSFLISIYTIKQLSSEVY